jgi:HlyD family secretion protein
MPVRRGFFARTWMMWLFLVIAAGGGGAYYYYNYATMASAEVAYVKRGTALTSVYGTVNVDPVEQIIVRTRNAGQLSAWKIKAGDVVKKNEVLAEITDDNLQREIDAAQSNLAQKKIQQSLGPPSAPKLKNQEIEVDKIQKLVNAGNLAQVELDKAKNLLIELRDAVQNEALGLDNDVDTIQRLLDGLQAQAKLNVMLAPIDGIVLNIYANPGEFLPPQTQICRIGSAANQIVANVNEEDIGDLKPGMKAQIRLYAYPDKNLVGTLLTVGSSAQNQIYPVSFSLDDTSESILPGMTGEMNVIIGEHKNALTLPTRAIRRGNSVWTVVDGVVKIVHINVGFHTLETSEVTEGLDEGTAVILSNQDLYHEGMHVRELNEKDN